MQIFIFRCFTVIIWYHPTQPCNRPKGILITENHTRVKMNKRVIYAVSQKKTSHFYFRHNFAICWDIFPIFEAPCSGLIAGCCNLLHTHHGSEAFTWCDVTHDVIQAVAAVHAHWHQISYHLTYGVWNCELTGLKSCWLFFLEYHAREGVPDTHSEYRWVETSASSGVWAELDHRHIAAAIGQW